jgi:3-methyladenine DNA glycosylase AlkD
MILDLRREVDRMPSPDGLKQTNFKRCSEPSPAMRSPTTANQLVTEVEREILSARSSTTPLLRAIRKDISKQIKFLDRRIIVEAALALIARNRVHRFVPYELVQKHPATMAGITWKEVELLGAGMESWSEVDSFGYSISGPAWATNRVSDAKVKAWAKSPDRWWRRAALVSTIALNRRPPAQHATKRTLEICRTLISDRDDMVVKAMSWALRRLSTVDSEAVRGFVSQHKGQIAGLIVREVTRKLETGRKNGAAGG